MNLMVTLSLILNPCMILCAALINSTHPHPPVLQFVAQMSFFAKISDPSIGGTYMTLLNTIANLGDTDLV